MELAPTAKEESFQQRFYLYLMMTKPSKQLVLSWCRTGADGKSRRPSFLIGELRAMFPNALLADQETQDDSEIYSVAEAKRKLSAELGRYRAYLWKQTFQVGIRTLLLLKHRLDGMRVLRSFWNCTAGLRPRTTIRRPCVI